MKKTKNLIVLAAVFFIFGSAIEANAQKRRTPRKRTAAVNTTNNAAEIRESATKVSTQLKNLDKFIYLLGGIAANIEDIDKKSRGQQVLQNEANKRNVIAAIRNFRAGLNALETDFMSKPSLKNYNFQIQGISDLGAQAEDLAASGKFTESGKVLLSVIEKLSDTLVYLP